MKHLIFMIFLINSSYASIKTMPSEVSLNNEAVNIIEVFPGALEVMDLAYKECGPTWNTDPNGDRIRIYWDKGGRYELRYSCNPSKAEL